MGNCNKKTSSKTLFIKQFSAVSSLMTNITTTLSGGKSICISQFDRNTDFCVTNPFKS